MKAISKYEAKLLVLIAYDEFKKIQDKRNILLNIKRELNRVGLVIKPKLDEGGCTEPLKKVITDMFNNPVGEVRLILDGDNYEYSFECEENNIKLYDVDYDKRYIVDIDVVYSNVLGYAREFEVLRIKENQLLCYCTYNKKMYKFNIGCIESEFYSTKREAQLKMIEELERKIDNMKSDIEEIKGELYD